jgi:hypothetical protein
MNAPHDAFGNSQRAISTLVQNLRVADADYTFLMCEQRPLPGPTFARLASLKNVVQRLPPTAAEQNFAPGLSKSFTLAPIPGRDRQRVRLLTCMTLHLSMELDLEFPKWDENVNKNFIRAKTPKCARACAVRPVAKDETTIT